jgi:hypothetical protein
MRSDPLVSFSPYQVARTSEDEAISEDAMSGARRLWGTEGIGRFFLKQALAARIGQGESKVSISALNRLPWALHGKGKSPIIADRAAEA